MKTAEMKILMRTAVKTVLNQCRNDEIRHAKQKTLTKVRTLERKEQINRMTEFRVVRIPRDKLPSGRRSDRRSRKRWNECILREATQTGKRAELPKIKKEDEEEERISAVNS